MMEVFLSGHYYFDPVEFLVFAFLKSYFSCIFSDSILYIYKMVYSKLLISILAVLAFRYTLADTEKDDVPVKSRMCNNANTQLNTHSIIICN